MTVKDEVILVGTCKGCGADVRAESAYCYNCGGKVDVDAGKSPADSVIPGQNGASAGPIVDSIVDSTSVPRPTAQKRRRERKRVHVVWEKSDGPGYLLVLFAVTVLVIVLAILAVAAYLK